MRPLKKTDPALPSTPPKSRWRSWVESKSPVFWFCGKFSLLILLYYSVLLPLISNNAMNGYLAATARISSIILNFFGENCQITGATIWSSQHAITVLSSCSALELAGFLCATVLAFPASPVRKAVGILAGVPFILALNLMRIMTLFSAGVHFRGYFDTIHEEVWPAALILATLLICAGWIHWAKSGNPTNTDVAA